MLSPDSRALLLDALRPPAGYSLHRAVATTFTLDLTTALTVPLAFAGYRFQAEPDPIEVMQSLREISSRFDLFCQAGAIRSGAWRSDLVALLEDGIHETRRPRPGHVFHPKVWVLRFVNESEEPMYRLLVLSRNLTADRSWDTMLWLDGRAGRRPIARNRPLARFVAALPDLATTPVQPERRAAIEELAQDLRLVEWELPVGVREVHFHPIGLPGLRPLDLKRVLGGYRRLVVSPFVRAGALKRLFDKAPEGGSVLVSRGEELDALPQRALNGIQAYELDPLASLSSDDVQDAPTDAVLSNLHAKIFVVERARLAHVLVGSANATDAGLANNVEFLCELIGSPSALGVAAFVGEDAPFLAMLKRYTPPDAPIADDAADASRRLEELLFDLAQVGFLMKVTEEPEGWAARVTTDEALAIPEGIQVTLAPHNRTQETSTLALGVPVGIELPPREAADITPFLQLTARSVSDGRALERSTIVCARLVGAPAERLEDIFVRQVNTPEKFMRLLALLLGLGAPASPAATSALDGAAARWSTGAGFGVLELLARALADQPESIDHLQSIVERLRATPTGRKVLPDGWDDVWLPALEARRALAEAPQ